MNAKDFNRQLFDKEQVHLKNMNNQCTRKEYIDKLKSIGPELVENCENKISECDILQNKVKKQIDKYLNFSVQSGSKISRHLHYLHDVFAIVAWE